MAPLISEGPGNIRELMSHGWEAPRSLEPPAPGAPEFPGRFVLPVSAAPVLPVPMTEFLRELAVPAVPPVRETGCSLVREEAYVYDETIKLEQAELAAIAAVLAAAYERFIRARVAGLKDLFTVRPFQGRGPVQEVLSVSVQEAASEETLRALQEMRDAREEGLGEVLQMYSPEEGGGVTSPGPQDSGAHEHAEPGSISSVPVLPDRAELADAKEDRPMPYSGPSRQSRRVRARKHAAASGQPEQGEGSRT